jgi:hypothetical protein
LGLYTFFLFLVNDHSCNLSFLKQKYRQRVEVDGLFSLTIGRGWGREELMSVNSKTVAVLHVGWGGTSSWPGLDQGLGRMEVV